TLHPHHVEHVVRIHLESFPTFFLSFLGARFLRELYGSFLVDPVGVGLVAVNQEDKVIGVAVGAIDPRGYFTRLLKRRWWAFCLGSIGAVAKRPSVTPRLFRALYYRGEPPTGPVRALLSSILVEPRSQNSGVGKLLIHGWVNEVRRRGAP